MLQQYIMQNIRILQNVISVVLIMRNQNYSCRASKRFIKDKEITNANLVKNHLQNQIISRKYIKAKEITNMNLVKNHLQNQEIISRQYIKDKAITNVILIGNHSPNQEMQLLWQILHSIMNSEERHQITVRRVKEFQMGFTFLVMRDKF